MKFRQPTNKKLFSFSFNKAKNATYAGKKFQHRVLSFKVKHLFSKFVLGFSHHWAGHNGSLHHQYCYWYIYGYSYSWLVTGSLASRCFSPAGLCIALFRNKLFLFFLFPFNIFLTQTEMWLLLVCCKERWELRFYLIWISLELIMLIHSS